MCSYCEGDDLDEVTRVVEKYGTNNNGEYRMNFKAFVQAANEGHIPKFPKAVIEKVFMEILSGANRDYITIEDMVEYYGELYTLRLEKILSEFGKKQNEEYRLTFPDFRRAVNIGVLPKPE
ncbi:uncharacterized protein LOC126847089 isoform X2 [Adelges cooleyi]|nr:uncharacterized protein LOC126847089 isoform X2 [Adelges cooleyi]